MLLCFFNLCYASVSYNSKQCVKRCWFEKVQWGYSDSKRFPIQDPLNPKLR